MRRSGRWLLALLAALTTAQAAPPKLAIVGAVLHEQREDGPEIPASYEYVPGELLYLSYRIAGFTVKNDAVDLRWQMYLTDPDGLLLAPISNGAVRDEVTARDKDWLPKVDQTVPLPPELYAGSFAIHLRVADELAQAEAERIIPFRVRGRAPEKLPGITARGVRFYHGEDDAVPLAPAIYRPGKRCGRVSRLPAIRLASTMHLTSSTDWPFTGRPGACSTNNPSRRRSTMLPFTPSAGSSADSASASAPISRPASIASRCVCGTNW